MGVGGGERDLTVPLRRPWTPGARPRPPIPGSRPPSVRNSQLTSNCNWKLLWGEEEVWRGGFCPRARIGPVLSRWPGTAPEKLHPPPIGGI